VVVLGTITRWRGRPPGVPFTWSVLIASVAIDLDHLPAKLATRGLLYGNLPRPYTHALWLLALLILLAVAAARRARAPGHARAALAAGVFAGASWGLASHFLRDITTAPISLLWPVSGAWLQIPYGWYLSALILLAILPPGRRSGHR
jgi:membrane-bound metal-dependent hydrolase YbcI (DUF457 family)